MEKEFLAVAFTLEKFQSYLINSNITVFTNHVALKHILKKPDSKPRLIQWVLHLQEFELAIRDKARLENAIIDHLSGLGPEATPIEEVPIDE